MTSEPAREIVIAIWGICKGNPGRGAYKAVLQNTRTGREKSVESRAASTTANRMELTAAIEALNSLTPGAIVTVVSNSEYVAKGMNEWLPGWRANGWRTSSKKPVQNADLWGALTLPQGSMNGWVGRSGSGRDCAREPRTPSGVRHHARRSARARSLRHPRRAAPAGPALSPRRSSLPPPAQEVDELMKGLLSARGGGAVLAQGGPVAAPSTPATAPASGPAAADPSGLVPGK